MNRIVFCLLCIGQMTFAIEISKEMPLQIEGSNIYKIFAEEDTTAFANLEITADNEPGNYTVEVGAVSGVFSSGWNEINFNIYKTPMLDIQKRTYSLHFAENDIAKQVQLVFTLPAQVVLPPGTYATEIPVKIMKGDEVIKDKIVTAFFNVDEQLTAKLLMNGIEREGEHSIIRFGNIYGEMEKDFSFFVKANTDVKVTISSKNNGRMVLDVDDVDETCYIPYTMQRKGKSFTLEHENTILAQPFAENINQLLLNIKVLLHPDINKTFCGKYRDRINITVSSL